MLNGGEGEVSTAPAHELRNALLEELEAADVESLTSEQLGAELKFWRATVDLIEVQISRRLAVFDSRQAFYELGEHSAVDWIRTHTHVSAASADSQVTLARQLEKLEPTVEAVQQGEISFEHALLIARQVSDLLYDRLAPAGQNLNVSKRVLATVGEPIRIHSVVLHGRRTPLDTFAVVVAVTVSLMLATLS